MRLSLPVLFFTLSACTSFIAPAPSNVGPQPPYNVFQVCVPGTAVTTIELGVRSAGAGGRRLNGQTVGKSIAGQSIFEGALSYGDDGIFVKLLPLEASGDQLPRVYLYPIQIDVKPDWSPWIEPAQLDQSVPISMDRLKRFKAPDPSQLSNAPKVRWRAEPIIEYNNARISPLRFDGIPSCR